MSARSGYLVFTIMGLLIGLYGIAHALTLQLPLDSLPVLICGVLGGYLLIVNYWAYLVVDDSPEPSIAASTHATVLGYLIILGLVSLRLHEQALPPELEKILPSIGLLLLIFGLLLSFSRSPAPVTETEFTRAELTELGIQKPIILPEPNADRYGIAPLAAYTLLSVLGFLLILYALSHTLHFSVFDRKLVGAITAIGILLILLSAWLYGQTNIVHSVRTYQHLALATVLCVLGFLLILALITLYLLPVTVSATQQNGLLWGGLGLIVFGFLLNFSGKRVVRLAEV